MSSLFFVGNDPALGRDFLLLLGYCRSVEKRPWKSYDFVMKLVSHSPAETRKIAARIAGRLKSNVIALEGELGAGKTTFVKGFAKALGVKQKITSPTFVLMKRYPLNAKRFPHLWHVDAYRLKDHRELIPLGIREIISDPKNIVVIEWADRVEKILPRRYIKIHLDHVGEQERKIEINQL